MFTSQKDTNAERKTKSKLGLFSMSFESSYAVALILFFVYFWTKHTKQNKTEQNRLVRAF